MTSANSSLEQLISEQDFTAVLKIYSLKITQPRLRVLEIVSQHSTAVSQPELEKILGNEIDRVTLYRVLSTFEEKGIVHKVFDLNGTAAYAMCSSDCTTETHKDHHVHFICSTCNSVYCLDEIHSPKIALPPGFHLDSIAVNVVGTCEKCKK